MEGSSGSEAVQTVEFDRAPLSELQGSTPITDQHDTAPALESSSGQADPDAPDASEQLMGDTATAHVEEDVETDAHVAALNALSTLVEQANAAVGSVSAGAVAPQVEVRDIIITHFYAIAPQCCNHALERRMARTVRAHLNTTDGSS